MPSKFAGAPVFIALQAFITKLQCVVPVSPYIAINQLYFFTYLLSNKSNDMLDWLQNLFGSLSLPIGRFASWLTTLLVVLICMDVFMRYTLNTSHVWVTELETHLFALIFLLGAAYTLKKDAHVRVDLFYANFSENRKALINVAGVLLFLIPWCLVSMRASYRYAYNSYKIRETSPDAGGLPALWVIKFAILLAFILLLLEAIALLIRSIQVLRGERSAVFPESNQH